MTTGGSVADTADLLRKHGMDVTDCVVLLDRQQGGKARLGREGVVLHSVVKVEEVLELLVKEGRIKEEMAEKVRKFLGENQVKESAGKDPVKEVLLESFEERMVKAVNPVAKKLFQLMLEKRSNLVVAVDCDKAEEVLRVVEKVAGHAVVVKVHADVVKDWSREVEEALVKMAGNHKFLVFEDRKLADIGNTVRLQAASITGWADLVTVHGVSGPGVLDGLKASVPEGRSAAALLVAEMSNTGNLALGDYTKGTVKMGEDRMDLVAGYISQSRLSVEGGLLQITPGVHRGKQGEGDQRYVTPREAVS